MRLSFSRAKAYDNCPAKFYHTYMIQDPIEQSESYLLLGKLGHVLAYRYVKHLVDTGQQSDHQAMEGLVEAVWHEEKFKYHISEFLFDDFIMLSNRILDMISIELSDRISVELPLAINADLKPVEYASPHAMIRGVLDRLDIQSDGNARVIDYKTGWRVSQLTQSMQLSLYALLARAHYPDIKDIVGQLYYIRFSKVVTMRLSDEEISKSIRWIKAINSSIAESNTNGTWPAQPGIHCKGCPIFQECPSRSTWGHIHAPSNEVEAHALVERLILAEKDREEIKNALKSWVNHNGPIEVGDAAFGYNLIERLNFNTTKIWNILQKRGLRAIDFMSVNKYELKRIGRRDPKLAEEIERSAEDVSFTRLELKMEQEK